MAGKHSKNFFDFRKGDCVKAAEEKAKNTKPLSLPFKIIITVLVISLALSTVFIGRFFLQGVKQKRILTNAREVFASMPSHLAIKKLAKENKDIKAWVQIEGTEIDGVVCHSKDNDFYLNHNQLGKRSRYGALFLSSDDTFNRKNGDKNIVIFGNNMNDGTMLGSLKNYRNLKFYKQHPFIDLYFGYKRETYVIFSVMLFADNGSYSPTQSSFKNKSDFSDWYDETLKRSILSTTVDVQYGDEFLTLVTSAKDFDGARLVVIAKKLRSEEVSEVNVSSSKVNANTKYPKAWYTERK